MKKYLSVFLFAVLMASPAFGGSYFYSFSSGDIFDPAATVTYGLGRIDFPSGAPIPTVLTSGDPKSITVGSFPRNGKTYLYSSKTDKKDTSTTQSTTTYTVYDPDKPLNGQINTAVPHDVVVKISNNISIDIALPPDDKTGMIYVIDNNATLMAYDPLTWNVKSMALPSGYDQHKLVSLAPDSYNYLYVWSSKRTDVSGDVYTPVSSDIHVYDRDTLEKLATFSNVRTGFDTTKQKADDEASLEMGRGLVYIADKFVVFVAYDTALSSDQAAHIVKIDENQIPTLGDEAASVLIESADIGYFNVDIESPMTDLKGGIYLECYSGDANAESRDSYVYHWDGSTEEIVSLDKKGAKANAELVIAAGKYKNNVLIYVPNSTISNDKLEAYVWDGADTLLSIDNGTTLDAGVEIEKPFTDNADGLYFMAERKVETEVVASSDAVREADALWWWDGSSVTKVWESGSELEIESPDMDANNGFYFVDVSTDIDVTNKEGTTEMTILYCRDGEYREVSTIGEFQVPKSIFNGDPEDPRATPQEILQDEFKLLPDYEYDLLLAGAGPLGGKYDLTTFNFSNRDTRPLTSDDILLPVYSVETLGGYVDLAGALKFTDASSSDGGKEEDPSKEDEDEPGTIIGSSGGGCDTGLGFLSFSLLAVFALKSKKN